MTVRVIEFSFWLYVISSVGIVQTRVWGSAECSGLLSLNVLFILLIVVVVGRRRRRLRQTSRA
jgi:hypothetical protein